MKIGERTIMTSRAHHTSQLAWGGVLLLLGSAMLLSNLDVFDLGSLWRHWPLIVVAMGIGKLISSETPRERGNALWWLFIGAWLYISVLRVFGFGFHDSWPILLIGIGISMVAKSFYRRSVIGTQEASYE